MMFTDDPAMDAERYDEEMDAVQRQQEGRKQLPRSAASATGKSWMGQPMTLAKGSLRTENVSTKNLPKSTRSSRKRLKMHSGKREKHLYTIQ